MSQTDTILKCPNCGIDIDVSEILKQQIEDQVQQQYGAEKAEQRKKYLDAMSALKAKEEILKEQEGQFQEQLNTALAQQLKVESQKLSENIKRQLLEEQSESMALLQKELGEKSEQLKELNKSKAMIAQLEREKQEIESRVQAQAELSLNQRLGQEKERISKELSEQSELKFKQKEEQMEGLKRQIDEMKRKAEQGSMQLQGEVQELAIEEWLSESFHFDTITEIKKGARGGDCIQSVHTREMQNCGTIYYESKRTKDFQRTWIEKFKADIREKGADVGVLVTEVMPSELQRMGLIDGIWICSYEEFKALCFILREGVIDVARANRSQENKSDKMSLLYGYLTSNEFKMQIEAIVEGFSQMQSDLDKERNAMQRIWKQREKQLTKVVENTVGLYGSIRGIAGNVIAPISMLELDLIVQDDDSDASGLF
jgi:hypothetical protein